MNRLDTPLQSMAPLHRLDPDNTPHRRPPRLIVVIPYADQEAVLASRILAVAQPRDLQITLLGISHDLRAKAELRRKLVTIAAFVRDGARSASSRSQKSYELRDVEILIVEGRDWMENIKSELHGGDLLACYSEQSIGTRQRPLSDALSSALNRPVYTFSGLQSVERKQNVVSRIAPWISSIASIAGFFLLQARIVSAVQGWAQSVLLILTLFAEVAVVMVVNALFTQS